MLVVVGDVRVTKVSFATSFLERPGDTLHLHLRGRQPRALCLLEISNRRLPSLILKQRREVRGPSGIAPASQHSENTRTLCIGFLKRQLQLSIAGNAIEDANTNVENVIYHPPYFCSRRNVRISKRGKQRASLD